jgi:AcrR family transcriptional regulator
MARRSDHSRAELESLIVTEGHRQMAEVGFARFSAREVAKRIGYSIGTLYNVFGSYDLLILAINGRTMTLWADHLRAHLQQDGGDRLAVLVRGYFDFARDNYNAWSAIYDHRLPPGEQPPEWYGVQRAELTGVVVEEIANVLPLPMRDQAPALARSLVASVHGHCVFALNGTFAMLGETDPQAAALARVREAVAAASRWVRI